jgi:hypothetical protein
MTRIRLPYVHAFRDRHGKLRHYFRRPGSKQIALPVLPGSEQFMAAYQAALAGVTAPRQEIGASRTKPGTVDAAVVGYYKSLASASLRRRRNACVARLLSAFAASREPNRSARCRRSIWRTCSAP